MSPMPLSRRLLREAAVLGGLFLALFAVRPLAAYASQRLSHVYHLNLLTIGWTSIFLLALHMLLEGRDGRRLFPGLLAPALAFLARVRRHRRAGLYAVATALLLVLSLGHELRVEEY